MYEYTSLAYYLKSLKCHKPLLLDYTVDIFYIVDENGEGVEHYVWHGKLKDCDPDNPVFKNYKYLWNDLPINGAHIIDICCKSIKDEKQV